MRAISMPRTSRTVIDATTSSRASFSLTLLRRISRICIAAPPTCFANACPGKVGTGFSDKDMRKIAALALSSARRYAAGKYPGGRPGTSRMEIIHELHDRVQVDPRPGLGRGVAGAGRSRGLLPADRQ